MPAGKALTTEQRNLILKLSERGYTILQIATQMRISYTTTQRFLQQPESKKDAGGKGNIFLTPAEMQILNLAKLGHSHKQIALKLYKEKQTVKNQVKVLLDKLYAYNTTHAVCIAIKLGLINLDDLEIVTLQEHKSVYNQ